MKNRFEMFFNLELYKKKNNLEITIFRDYCLVVEYLDDGLIYYSIKNEYPYMFNRMKFERKQRRLLMEVMNEINDL